LQWLALHRAANRRVMQEHDATIGGESRQRRLELERLLHRLVHEILHDLFSPRPERAPAEATAEPAHAREADVSEFPSVAVEYLDSDVAQDANDLALFARLEVVIPEHTHDRDLE